MRRKSRKRNKRDDRKEEPVKISKECERSVKRRKRKRVIIGIGSERKKREYEN